MKKEIPRAEELSDIVYTVYAPQCKTIEKGEEARYSFEPLRGVITASVMFRFTAEGRGKQVLGLYSTEGELVLSVFCDGMGGRVTESRES